MTYKWTDEDGREHEHCEVCGDCVLCGPCYCEILEKKELTDD